MVKYTLLLLLLPFHLMAAMPPGVAPGATFDSRGHVWVLTANNQQVIWFENGVKKAEGPFEHNQKRGVWTHFYESGKIKGTGAYEANLKQGPWKIYHPEGKVESEGSFKNDARSGKWVYYDKMGNKSAEGEFRAGMKEGPWVSYYGNGQVASRGSYRAGEAQGAWEYFFEKGQPFQSGQFDGDVRIGTWTICVAPQGPCGKEVYNSASKSGAPAVSGLNPAELTSQEIRNAKGNPARVLESMEGDVPDAVPSSINQKWND